MLARLFQIFLTLVYQPCPSFPTHCVYYHLFRTFNRTQSPALQVAAFTCILAVPKLVLRHNGRSETRNRNWSSFHNTVRARIAQVMRGKRNVLYENALSVHLSVYPRPVSMSAALPQVFRTARSRSHTETVSWPRPPVSSPNQILLLFPTLLPHINWPLYTHTYPLSLQ